MPGMFRVEVVASPAGEATATVELDVDSLLARRGLLQHAVLASAVPSRRVLPETEQSVREVGEVLFAALLGTGEVAGRYRAAAAVAALREEGLRVVLRIDTSRLAGLPWETMYDRAAGAYVCRRDQLVRHVPVASVPAPLRVPSPLRILGVTSSPRGLPPLDMDKEQDQLARALTPSASQGLVKLHWAPSATWADLQDLLLAGEWHILHFVGHGDYDPDRDEGVLALTRDDGRADMVAAHRLTDLLHQARPMPRLVVLNSCSGGTTGVSDLFSGTAAALVNGGISAVAAMQYEISDPAAIAFARGFYTAIARGRGVDDAVSSGRVAILGLSDRTLEWVTPVLYLRGYDSHLFTVPPAPEQRNREHTDAAESSATRRTQPGETSGTSGTAPSADLDRPAVSPAAPRPSRLTRTLIGHTRDVIGVAFSSDGTLLATASWDKTARLWDVATGECVRTFTHTDAITAMAFSPDSTWVATSGHGVTFVWKAATGERVHVLGHAYDVTALAFSPDGLFLATTANNVVRRGSQEAELRDVATGGTLRTFRGHTNYIYGVVFSPDGTQMATASWDHTARLWDVVAGECVRTFTGHTSLVSGVAFSPDGSLLATGSGRLPGRPGEPLVSDDRTARLWDVATGECIRTFTGHASEISGVAFSPDGTLLATAGGREKTARLWDVATGKCVRILIGHVEQVRGVAFSPDGTLLATASSDKTARLWG